MATPAQSPDAILETLRDLDGVHGSFLISEVGELLARDMPRYFDDGVLDQVGPCAAQALLTLRPTRSGAECVIRFEGHKLYFCFTGTGLLCALLHPEVHMPSLRSGVQMVVRRLAQLPERSAQEPPRLLPAPSRRSRSTPPPPPGGRPSVPPSR